MGVKQDLELSYNHDKDINKIQGETEIQDAGKTSHSNLIYQLQSMPEDKHEGGFSLHKLRLPMFKSNFLSKRPGARQLQES